MQMNQSTLAKDDGGAGGFAPPTPAQLCTMLKTLPANGVTSVAGVTKVIGFNGTNCPELMDLPADIFVVSTNNTTYDDATNTINFVMTLSNGTNVSVPIVVADVIGQWIVAMTIIGDTGTAISTHNGSITKYTSPDQSVTIETDTVTGEVRFKIKKEIVSYSTAPAVFPSTPESGDEHFITSDGTATGVVYAEFIFDGTQWTARRKVPITLPTPRIWARHTGKSVAIQSGTTAGSFDKTEWAIPEIYAQQFSEDLSMYQGLNPIYEIVRHKRVKNGKNSVLRGAKWVHTTHLNGINGLAGSKYAVGKTYNKNSGGQWQDKYTEFATPISTSPLLLDKLNPEDFITVNNTDMISNGTYPLTRAYPVNDFYKDFQFAPKRGGGVPAKGSHKMAFAVRIRCNNPLWTPATTATEPYLYGDVSNVLVYMPTLHNLWDGSTKDSAGNNVLERYFFNWKVTEENNVD